MQRLTRARQREAAVEAVSGAGGRAGVVTRGATRSGGAAPGAAAVALPASRPDGGAQPSDDDTAGAPGMQPAAQLNRRLRDDRLFGGASAAAGDSSRQRGGPDSPDVQQAGSSRGVSIGPAGRAVSGSAAVEPVSVAAAGSSAVLAAGAPAAGAIGSAQTAEGGSGSGDDSSGDDAGEAATADAMQPMSGTRGCCSALLVVVHLQLVATQTNGFVFVFEWHHVLALPKYVTVTAGAELTQRELVAMAFAGDDVAADFAAQKAEEADAEAPAADAAPGALPGWGSWASAKRMQRDAEAAARKAQQ